MAFIPVGEENSTTIELYYEDVGKGQPVVLIHGWPLTSKSWEKQCGHLVAAGYRVISYDRRGFGKSSKPSFGYDNDTLASDLHIVMNQLDLRNAALVGFSMGGCEVARYIGIYGAGRVSKAAFVSAVTPYLLKTADNPDGVDQSVFDEIKANIVADRPAQLKAFFKLFYKGGMLSGKSISDEALHASWTEALPSSPTAMIQTIDSWLADFRPDLRKFTIPTLVVHGDSDHTVPMASSGARMSAILPNSRYVPISGAPHGLNWTHAEELNKELLTFLRG